VAASETADATQPNNAGRPERKRSLIQLLADIPAIVRELVAGEIELLKQEMIRKLKALGAGAGLLVVALICVFGMLGVLLTAAVLGLAETGIPGWLSALIVAAVLLIIAAIIGLVGYRVLKKGIPPLPNETIAGLKKDLGVIRGVGRPTSRERE
jgi:tetrahydromethanopterin S-methyltransferase subunit C